MTSFATRAAIAFAAMAALCAARPAAAQNQVYDPLPPAGSAYVRFVNATGAELALSPDFLGAQKLGTDGAKRVSAYMVVEKIAGRALTLDAQAGSQKAHAVLKAEPGSYLTVIVREDKSGAIGIAPVVDQADFNQSRVRLSFYNATADCADGALTLEPNGAAVFKDVAPESGKSRTVNPVTAQVKAACASLAAEPVALEGLEAGAMYSVWLMAPGGKPVAFRSTDTTARYKP